jgi:hypothetical protein
MLVHPATDTAVLRDIEDITDVVDAALLQKKNPADGERQTLISQR